MYYLGFHLKHFSFSSFFFKALMAKEWKEAIFCYRINFDISIPVFASWGIFYFLEILNQVIHIVIGLISCLSRVSELPFPQSSPFSVPDSMHRCTHAIISSFKTRIYEIFSNTNKVIVFLNPVLCSFCSCPYDVFWFSVLVGKQGLHSLGSCMASDLLHITGKPVSSQRAKGIFENPVKCINNGLRIKSKPCLDISIESRHTTVASLGWKCIYILRQIEMDFTSLNAALVQTKAIGGGGESTGCHHHHIWLSFPITLAILYLFRAVTYHRKSLVPNSRQKNPICSF